MTTNVKTIMEHLNGTGFIGFDALTQVKPLPGGQRNPYQNRVTKRTSNITACIYQNKYVNGYEQAVRRKLIESGLPADFKVGPLPWGTKIENTPFILHNGNAYIQMIIRNEGTSEYLVDGKVVKHIKVRDNDVLVDEYDLMITQLPKHYSTEGQQGGLSENMQVDVRAYMLSSITELRAFGQIISNKQLRELHKSLIK